MNSYGNPYQPAPGQGGMGSFGTGFGGFVNDPTAQIGLQVGQKAFDAGQEYMQQNVCQATYEQGRSLMVDYSSTASYLSQR
jgi:hypothetical protein